MKLKKVTACLLAAILSFSAFAPTVQAAEATTVFSTSQAIVPEEAKAYEPDVSDLKAYTVTLPANTETAVYEIQTEYAGYIYIPMSITGTEKGITAQLYSDAACTSKVGYSQYLSSGTLEKRIYAPISKAGTYYLQFSTFSPMASEVAITLYPYSFNGETRKIKENEDVYSFSGNSELLYHKISIPKTGYIRVEADSSNSVGSTYVSLHNSKKKPCSESVYLSDSSKDKAAYFGVKKGTYYIAVKGSSSDPNYLKYSFTEVKEKSGTSKKNAVSISKGKTAKGVMLPTDSMKKYDYYKIKLSKKQVLSLTYSAKSCDRLRFTVIPASSRLTLFGSSATISASNKGVWKTKDKLPAGTYYIQVEKGSKDASGYYTIKFNK